MVGKYRKFWSGNVGNKTFCLSFFLLYIMSFQKSISSY